MLLRLNSTSGTTAHRSAYCLQPLAGCRVNPLQESRYSVRALTRAYNSAINPSHAIPELNDASLAAFVAQSQGLTQPVLLIFHARWSRPARTVLPQVEELAAEYDKLVRFALVDAAAAPEALDRYGVLTLPSFIFLRGQRVTDRFTGVHGRDMLVERLEHNLRRLG